MVKYALHNGVFVPFSCFLVLDTFSAFTYHRREVNGNLFFGAHGIGKCHSQNVFVLKKRRKKKEKKTVNTEH